MVATVGKPNAKEKPALNLKGRLALNSKGKPVLTEDYNFIMSGWNEWLWLACVVVFFAAAWYAYRQT
jgi:hypothetical protein